MQVIGLIMTFMCLMVAEVMLLVGCRGRTKGLSSLLTRLTLALWFPAEFDAADRGELDRTGEEGPRRREGGIHGRALPLPQSPRRPRGTHGD